MMTKRMTIPVTIVALMVAMCLALVANAAAQAATTFVVNQTGDAPDASTATSACDTDTSTTGKQCTLRAAIQQANATAGADTINFNISGTGVKTISPASSLPLITEQVTIDGYTQTGASPNTKAIGNDAALKIQLNGTNALVSSGLAIDNSSGSVIKGLVINRFGIDGIEIHGDSVGNRIEGNFIGTNPAGTLDRGNVTDAVGIFDGPSETVVGGTTPAARNLLSGNGDTGVFVSNSNANLIQGNYVGTDRSGTKDLGNEDGGVFVSGGSPSNTVGGSTSATRNVISGNDADGLDIVGVGTSNNVAYGNRIGTTADGTGALGNTHQGVFVSGSRNFIGRFGAPNTIAFNGAEGLNVSGGTQNLLDANSIFSNAAIGIDLSGGVEDAAGRTANDPGDTDTGSNGLQNFPVITSAKTVSGKTTITGTLNSIPSGLGSGYTVQFFSNPPGGDEGKTFLGEDNFDTDASGNLTFTFSPSSPVAVGKTITATAIASFPNSSDLDTSEFSAPRTVTSS